MVRAAGEPKHVPSHRRTASFHFSGGPNNSVRTAAVASRAFVLSCERAFLIVLSMIVPPQMVFSASMTYADLAPFSVP